MRFQIILYKAQFRLANYPRPCVVIDPILFRLMNVTTKQYENFNRFTIHKEHPDFPKTGLKETSFVIGAPVVQGDPSNIIASMGALEGDLAKEFAIWIGD